MREYWIVDPDRESVEVLRLSGERFGPGRILERARQEVLESSTIAGLELPLVEIFA